MKTHAASILHLAPIRAMRSFTMKRLLVFLGFSLVGVLLSFADALQVEQGVVIVMRFTSREQRSDTGVK